MPGQTYRDRAAFLFLKKHQTVHLDENPSGDLFLSGTESIPAP
jgi:hypothetical protein